MNNKQVPSNTMIPISSHPPTVTPFLKSLDYTHLEPTPPSSITPQNDFESLNLHDKYDNDSQSDCIHLLDDREQLLIKSEKEFIEKLKIENNQKVKVVSIFGNSGEGKSFTLNQTFFKGKEVFRTSPFQNSCTMGVWAKYEPKMGVICLDTEGMLGISKKELNRTRLLLKILAVSDVIIYRTKSERLHRDMYTFLGGASRAFTEHFGPALKKMLEKYEEERPAAEMGPAVIIFHETRYTETLNTSLDVTKSPEEILRENFTMLEQDLNGFSSLKYVGFKNNSEQTSFKELAIAIEKELQSSQVRSPRDAKYIYFLLKAINDKFKTNINAPSPHQLCLSPFFTCQDKCRSCGAACCLSMGHKDEGKPHYSNSHCKMQHQFENYVYLCKKCYHNGSREIVERNYCSQKEQTWIPSIWFGYALECPTCGTIYQSRRYWYGNRDPEEEAVMVDIVHVWPGEKSMFNSHNSAQKVLDGVTSISNVVASVGSQPTKMFGEWVTDQIAPSYWRPNSEITECFKCKGPFASNASKHHCRSCGEGFCEGCSSRSQPVPARGWPESVRVCDDCYREQPPSDKKGALTPVQIADGEVRSRRIGETVISSISAAKSVLDIGKEKIKDSARPSYWVPDSECIQCAVCESVFGALLPLHHCRECGRGVCDPCSGTRKPVPRRGWEAPARVCNRCLD